MWKMRKFKIFSSLVLLLVALTLVARAMPTTDVVSADTGWEKQIREASAAWDEAFNAENLEQLMELYAEDAVSMPPGFAELEGKVAIAEDFEFIFATYDFEHKTYIVDMLRSGNLVVEQGQYTLKDKNADEVIECGKHIVVREKSGNSWKVVKEAWNFEFGAEYGNDPAELGCPVSEP